MSLNREKMLLALTHLDRHLLGPLTLIVGGGGAMILAHHFPLSTFDIDAIPKGRDMSELDPLIKTVARELGLPPDWLNPWFATFAHTLPSDYGSRLITVFEGQHLRADALSKNEMLIMKCFAHRPKDVGHAKALIKKGADIEFVRNHMEALKAKGIPGCDVALDFLDDQEDSL